jgi:hypothetical protein
VIEPASLRVYPHGGLWSSGLFPLCVESDCSDQGWARSQLWLKLDDSSLFLPFPVPCHTNNAYPNRWKPRKPVVAALNPFVTSIWSLNCSACETRYTSVQLLAPKPFRTPHPPLLATSMGDTAGSTAATKPNVLIIGGLGEMSSKLRGPSDSLTSWWLWQATSDAF